MRKPFLIAVDFDGTIVDHAFPAIGPLVPDALRWLSRYRELGATLILWTIRSDSPQHDRLVLRDAVAFLAAAGIFFDHVNCNPQQAVWSISPKVYANVYIDDAAACCPLSPPTCTGGRPTLDWSIVGPAVEALLLTHIKENT